VGGLVSWIFQRSASGCSCGPSRTIRKSQRPWGIDIHRTSPYLDHGRHLVGCGGRSGRSPSGAGSASSLGLKVFPIVIVGGLDSILGTLLGHLHRVLEQPGHSATLDPLLGAGFGSMVSYLVLIRCSSFARTGPGQARRSSACSRIVRLTPYSRSGRRCGCRAEALLTVHGNRPRWGLPLARPQMVFRPEEVYGRSVVVGGAGMPPRLLPDQSMTPGLPVLGHSGR